MSSNRNLKKKKTSLFFWLKITVKLLNHSFKKLRILIQLLNLGRPVIWAVGEENNLTTAFPYTASTIWKKNMRLCQKLKIKDMFAIKLRVSILTQIKIKLILTSKKLFNQLKITLKLIIRLKIKYRVLTLERLLISCRTCLKNNKQKEKV